MKFSKLIKRATYALASLAIALIAPLSAYADEESKGDTGLTLSPMNQTKVLTPGYTEVGTVTLANPYASERPIAYSLELRSFIYDDEKGEIFAETEEQYSPMIDWITLSEDSGTLEPNESKEITFTIDVPEDAPAGGQYVAIVAKAGAGGVGPFAQTIELAHLIYADVAGESIRKGNIISAEVPSFLTTGNITGSASIKNEGNTHAYATHVLKVLPLFGNEEFFTNEEEPQNNLIMPGATRYTKVSWDKTPTIGIFRVQYTVEFEGVKKEVSKVVIVCPLWLLIIIALIVLILIYRIFAGRKSKK